MFYLLTNFNLLMDDLDHNQVNILFALPIMGHPRHSKRITMLKEGGFSVKAVAFKRQYHRGRMPDCELEVIGNIENLKYIKRTTTMLRSLPKLRRAMRGCSVIYAAGIDMALMSLVAGFRLNIPVVVEIGDIREILTKHGVLGSLSRSIDKKVVDSCSLIVATASDFIEEYYRKRLNVKTDAIVIENKLEEPDEDSVSLRSPHVVQRKPFIDRPLRIGYFGYLRCEWSWQMLKSLAISRPSDIEVVVAGFSLDPSDLNFHNSRYSNITYLGEYRSPQDLPSLYNSIDIVWACHPFVRSNDWNARWSRTNRFYESCYFQKPIISRYGCTEAIDVKRYNIGMVVTGQRADQIIDAFDELKSDDVLSWKNNFSSLPPHVYLYTTEKHDLKERILSISRE